MLIKSRANRWRLKADETQRADGAVLPGDLDGFPLPFLTHSVMRLVIQRLRRLWKSFVQWQFTE